MLPADQGHHPPHHSITSYLCCGSRVLELRFSAPSHAPPSSAGLLSRVQVGWFPFAPCSVTHHIFRRLLVSFSFVEPSKGVHSYLFFFNPGYHQHDCAGSRRSRTLLQYVAPTLSVGTCATCRCVHLTQPPTVDNRQPMDSARQGLNCGATGHCRTASSASTACVRVGRVLAGQGCWAFFLGSLACAGNKQGIRERLVASWLAIESRMRLRLANAPLGVFVGSRGSRSQTCPSVAVGFQV